LFVGTTSGWYLWSVYGHLLASSFVFNMPTPKPDESNGSSPSGGGYVDGVVDCCWAATGLHLIALAQDSSLLYSLPFARSVVTSCYNPVCPLLDLSYARTPSHNQCYRLKTVSLCIGDLNNGRWI